MQDRPPRGAATRVRPLPAPGGLSMSQRNELAAKRGYHYRISRRAFLVSASAAAIAACAPSGSTGGNAASSAAATAAATAGKAMKIGQLLPFTKVYAELGNSMKRSTDLYLKTKGNRLANRPVTVVYEDEATIRRSAWR